jgi:hypothetical protein
MIKSKFAARITLVAASLVGVAGLSASAAHAAPSHPTSPSVSAVGNYKYNDSKGDHNEGLQLNANGTVLFSSGCSGIWVQQGSAIAMDINANCGNTWIFTGTVNSAGLSSNAHRGRLEEFSGGASFGSWYAVRV